MGFRRGFLGYRRAEVEDAISARDARILGLELTADTQRAALSEFETETTSTRPPQRDLRASGTRRWRARSGFAAVDVDMYIRLRIAASHRSPARSQEGDEK